MPAELRLLGWKALGLRCPDHDIDCAGASGDLHRITLIQMPNGTGKTTTLSLLRSALSGTFNGEAWNSDSVAGFRKRGTDSPKSGLFELRLLLNARRATILMTFDFEYGRVTYKTTAGSGQQPGFHPPRDFKRFLNPHFVNFFVFDGELAQRLLDRSHTNAEAAVETLFQISTFTSLGQRVKEYWTERTQNASVTEVGRSRRENRVAYLETRLTVLKTQKRALEERAKEIATRLKNKQDIYDHEIEKDEALAAGISQAAIKIEQARARVREHAAEVFDAMREPAALSPYFASAIADFKAGLDRVKLPDSAAREFFKELADEPECVCGRTIDEHIRTVIQQRAARYLASDDVLLLSAIKTAVSDAVGASYDAPEKSLQLKISGLEAAVAEERDALNALDELRIQAEQADPAVKLAKEEIDLLRESLDTATDELSRYASKDQQQNDDNTFGIEILEKRLKDAENKLAEITRTMQLKAKRDLLLSILESAHKRARNAITKEICQETNKRILEVMPHNNISISRIDRSLVLEGQEGGSVGETLSVAYAFLSTLFNRSEHQLPFVVDSPAGPVDLAVRPKIAELIPRLTSQFIAFTISSEREGFVRRLKGASKSEVQFLTLFRKGAAELQQTVSDTDVVVETMDGLLVNGEDFFNEFQMDEEVS